MFTFQAQSLLSSVQEVDTVCCGAKVFLIHTSCNSRHYTRPHIHHQSIMNSIENLRSFDKEGYFHVL